MSKRPVLNRVKNVWRAVRQKWGPETVRRSLWNDEYAGGVWRHCEETVGDCVYMALEKYAKGGDILDLGAGSGNTGAELDSASYRTYTGVEISDVAVEEARQRSVAVGRESKNRYLQGDITKYVPEIAYDVILFRDSIYYIPVRRIRKILKHYVNFLKSGGVFVARFYNEQSARPIVDLIARDFSVTESYSPPGSDTRVLVFRPR